MLPATSIPPLTRFWLALERLPGLAAVAPLWRELLRADYDRVLTLLNPDPDPAESFPDLTGGGLPYDVVTHGPDDIVGVREDFEPIPLCRADLVVYRLDAVALVRAIAGAFGIDADGNRVEGLTRVYHVGVYRPKPGSAFPIYLSIQPEWRAHLWAVDALLVQVPGPFFLLAPTTHHHRGIAQSRLETRAAAFLPLADTIRCGDGVAWGLTDAARSWLGEFRSRVVPETDTDAVHFPTPGGARWSDVRIGFLDGHRVTVKVATVKRTLNYTQMGFVDRRSAEPDVQWELLRAFARGSGTLTWDRPEADRKNQKRKELLAQALQAFFRIEGDPIVTSTDGTGWRTEFAVVPD
jgi:hypothetical protein